MLSKYRIAETELFSGKLKEAPYRTLSAKITDYVYPQLRANPFFGPNIKRLKGEFSEMYRYRTGHFRLFYVVKEADVVVIMVDIAQRNDAY